MNYVNWVGFTTIVHKEIMRFFRIWIQALLPPVISMTLYFIIFGSLIGARIGKIYQFDYMQFIAPGLIMMAIMTNAYANVVASFYGMRFQKSFEEMLVAPLKNSTILLGFVAGGVARGLIVGIMITVIALFFTHLEVKHGFVLISVTILTAILFSLFGFTNALFARNFDDISIIPTFVITPLTYLGGVFYSTQLLPEPWRSISHLNPILYMVNAFRYGILGISDINVYFALLMIGVFTVIMYIVNLHLLNKGAGIRN